MGTFASRTTKTVPIPFDPPHEVLIQQLAGRHLQKAHQAFFNELIEGVKQRGGAAVQKDLETLFQKDDSAAAIAAVQKDPLNGYDLYVICQKGIKTWTFTEDGVAIPVTPETIDDLNDEAVRWFAEQIMRLTKPALFQTTDEQAADQKKGDGVASLA